MDNTIDNLGINVEVTGNAQKKLEKIDQALDSVKESTEEFTAAFKKIDLDKAGFDRASEQMADLIMEGKGLEDSKFLSAAKKQFSAAQGIAKELEKSVKVTPKISSQVQNDIKSISEPIENVKIQLNRAVAEAEKLAAQGKRDTKSYETAIRSADRYSKKLEELVKAKERAEKALQLPDLPPLFPDVNTKDNIAVNEKLAQTLKRVGAVKPTAPPVSNADVDTLVNSYTKVADLNIKIGETKDKIKDLVGSGATVQESPELRKLIQQTQKLQTELKKVKAEEYGIKDGFGEQVNLMDFAGKPIKESESLFEKLRETAKSTFSTISKGVEKVSKHTKKGNNSFKNYHNGLRGLLRTAKQFIVFGTFFRLERLITTALKEGVDNIYQFSRAIDGDLADSMDRMSTSALFLKNSIAAIGAPIIKVITPAIERLVDRIAYLNNKIAETMAALAGQSTYKKAIKYQKEYADAINNTNNALAKFDEINNITTQKAGAGEGFEGMFEVDEVAPKGWFKQLVDAVKAGNWNEVGTLFSKKLNEQVEKINRFDLGTKLGNKINSTVELANGMVGNFDWSKFAKTITKGIENFVIGINWKNIGDLFSTSLIGAIDFLDTVTEWLGKKSTRNAMTDSIVNLIDGIEWGKIGESIGSWLVTAFENAIKWLVDWKNLGRLTLALGEAILKLVSGAFKGLTKGKGNFDLKGMRPSKAEQEKWERSLSNGGNSRFAKGGFPTSGQMFIANEAGPELVGNIGGRTAVANQDQIVEAVSLGVYNAVSEALNNSRSGDGGETVINIDGREVFRAVRSQNDNFRRRTGASAF